MRISDWSSDVCSSDLQPWLVAALAAQGRHHCLQSGKADGYVGFADDQSSAGGECACRGELFAGQRYTGGCQPIGGWNLRQPNAGRGGLGSGAEGCAGGNTGGKGLAGLGSGDRQGKIGRANVRMKDTNAITV